ncbi:MAG: hypothetical protein H7288_12120 [Kineosporiaceae bacterium]|nr:hypothetical protein [Aeromicrobium sp.]
MHDEVDGHASKYVLANAASYGYTKGYVSSGMFYSNLADVTIYPTPV